jgi:hypothetical protein
LANAMTRSGLETRACLRRLLDELREFASSRNDDIIVRVMSRWISVKSKNGGRVFAELRPSKERIEVFILPPPRELGSNRLIDRAPPSQGWGWFKSKFVVDGNGGGATALRLLRISYLSSLRRDKPSSRRR